MTTPVKTTIGTCDLWLGDCRDVLPLIIADGGCDMVFTDPPYGHNNNDGDLISNWEKALGQTERAEPSRPILNDGPEANDLFKNLLPYLNTALRHGGCCCCCCGGGGPDPQFARWCLWLDDAIGFKQMVVWDKGPIGMGWHYRRSYETVLVAEKKGAACRWFDTSGRIENIIRPGSHGIRKIIPAAHDHPTPKPVELPAHFINLHTAPGDLVLDPFMGAGTTGVACVRLGRRFVGIELDPHWHQVAVDRITRELNQGDLFRAPLKAAGDAA